MTGLVFINDLRSWVFDPRGWRSSPPMYFYTVRCTPLSCCEWAHHTLWWNFAMFVHNRFCRSTSIVQIGMNFCRRKALGYALGLTSHCTLFFFPKPLVVGKTRTKWWQQKWWEKALFSAQFHAFVWIGFKHRHCQLVDMGGRKCALLDTQTHQQR